MEANPKIENWNCSIGVTVCVFISQWICWKCVRSKFLKFFAYYAQHNWKFTNGAAIQVADCTETEWTDMSRIHITHIRRNYNCFCSQFVCKWQLCTVDRWTISVAVDRARWPSLSSVLFSELFCLFIRTADFFLSMQSIDTVTWTTFLVVVTDEGRTIMQRCGHMQVNGTKLVLDLEISNWLQVFSVNMYNVQVHRTDSTQRHIRIVPFTAARSYVEWLWRENLCKPIPNRNYYDFGIAHTCRFINLHFVHLSSMKPKRMATSGRRAHWQSESKQIKVLLTE